MTFLTFISFFGLMILTPSPSFSVEYDPNLLFFEHWRHYDSQGIACGQCHTLLESGVFSLPDHDVCGLCHRQEMADESDAKRTDCGQCHPKKRTGAITRLTIVPRTEKRYFYHSSKLESLCHVCHGKMMEDIVPLGQLVLSKESRVQVRQRAHYFYNKGDCGNCHLNMGQDTPPENHNNDWLKEHITVAPRFNCQICHKKNFCQVCHESTY